MLKQTKVFIETQDNRIMYAAAIPPRRVAVPNQSKSVFLLSWSEQKNVQFEFSQRNMWPLASIVCFGCLGFLVAATIVLALIPLYLPTKDVVPSDGTNATGSRTETHF